MDVQITNQEMVILTAPPSIPHLILAINRVIQEIGGSGTCIQADSDPDRD